MKFSWRKWAAGICAILGIVSWLYLGVYRLWKGPLKKLIKAHLSGEVTFILVVKVLLGTFLCLTFAGLIWCLWYILRGYFKGRK